MHGGCVTSASATSLQRAACATGGSGGRIQRARHIEQTEGLRRGAPGPFVVAELETADVIPSMANYGTLNAARDYGIIVPTHYTGYASRQYPPHRVAWRWAGVPLRAHAEQP